ncbi:hypothetical protein TSUD_198610 [Trifolium subterraneum]|uniref:Uncharacterized protein n=1 Tax=Trifolium subterraneum TaxID=3900 RepID=A0A2Z6LMA0_TRISU|nr:hypothetical protein TSUD_198610 [Trifolium subterraneum]
MENYHLIENALKKTLNCNICLQSHKANANDGLNKIIRQLKRLGNGDKKALSSYGVKYRAILAPVILQAKLWGKGAQNLQKMVQDANAAANEATYCEWVLWEITAY